MMHEPGIRNGAAPIRRRSSSRRNSTTDPLDELYRRPGFLIRRANQIAVALFLEQTGALGITTSQYGILTVLKHHPGIDQISLAKLLGLDRSTTGMVLDKLQKAGLIGRSIGAHDKRRRNLSLTKAGERMLTRLAEPAQRAQAHVLSPFTAEERDAFVSLLDKFVAKFNGTTRVPLHAGRTAAKRSAVPLSTDGVGIPPRRRP
jgi:MarR family transcriptional regulator, lower aerobic nicotinate degradation pathway regulator